MRNGHAVSVIIIGPGGYIPIVRDPLKPEPRYWKFPGGREDSELEDAKDVAVREIEEELGLSIKKAAMETVFAEDRHSHMFTLFFVRVKSFVGLKEFGEEGEEIKTVKMRDILASDDFFPPHAKILRTLL